MNPKAIVLILLDVLFLPLSYGAFTQCRCFLGPTFPRVQNRKTVELRMALDLVTYLRTEWVSAALCTNQTPRTAKTVLQIGTEDGRAVNFVPRTVQELITSSIEKDGKLSVSCRRQLKQQRDARGAGITVKYVDQRADNLNATADESVDVVISLQAADKMREVGMDWKKSIQESARVLKKGGRFLFVEKTIIGENDDYLEMVMSLEDSRSGSIGVDLNNSSRTGVFELVGYDDVDLVLVPHIAGVVMKSELAGLTIKEIEARKSKIEQDRIADLTINAFERGLKKRKKKVDSSKDSSGIDVNEKKSLNKT